MRASLIVRVDAPPIFEFYKCVLDFMAMPVEALVIRNLDFAI
jgi:hypothetical protein